MIKKFLITGFSGFVSRHFLDFLELNSIDAEILGLDIESSSVLNLYKNIKINFSKVDLQIIDNVEKVLTDFNPDYILHLASLSSVAYSWQEPVNSYNNNLNIYLNIIESIRKNKINCRVLSVGSSEIYGNINNSNLPLKEDYQFDPQSPYAVARVSQELMSKIYVNGYGLDIVMTRSFNHIGPGQRDVFVIPSIIKQLVEIKKGILKDNVLKAGNVSIVRDFTDVRDVCNGYYNLLKSGINGEVYNICSGSGHSLRNIIDLIARKLQIDVTVEVDDFLVRPNDNWTIIGSNEKMKKQTDWKLLYNLELTLSDMIDEWMNKL